MEIIQSSKLVPLLNTMRNKFFGYPKEFNITGIRFDCQAMDNKFDDLLIFHNAATSIISIATTIPGKFWTLHPMQGVAGTAHMKPRLYEDSHVIGIHGAKYPGYAHEAWVQCGLIEYRQDIKHNGTIEISEPTKQSYETRLNIQA